MFNYLETKNVIALVFCISNTKSKFFHFKTSNAIRIHVCGKLYSSISRKMIARYKFVCFGIILPTAIMSSRNSVSSLGAKIFTNFGHNKMTLHSFPSREIEATIGWSHSIFSAETVNYFKISNAIVYVCLRQIVFFYF